MNHSNVPRIEQYEASHAIPRGKLTELGWRSEYHKDSVGKERPCISFPTANGRRYRFTDGEKPKYHHAATFAPCWSGLKRAVDMGRDYIVNCNGLASTIAGYYAGLPAFNLESGESTNLTPALIQQIKDVGFAGVILVAFDCDPEGRRGGEKRVQQLRAAGFMAEAVDLALDKDGGDLADFVAKHGDNTRTAFETADLFYIEKEQPKAPRKIVDFPHDKEQDYELAVLALDALDSGRRDDYDQWKDVGMSLQELGERGLYLWDRWSIGGDGYKSGACERKWRSFKKGGINLGSLFHWATEDSPTWRPKREKPIADRRRIEPDPTVYEKADTNWRHGVPTAVRAAAVSLLSAAVAPVFELWFEGSMRGDLDWETPITSQYLQCLSDTYRRGLSKKEIDRGLSSGLGQLWGKLDLDAEQFGTTFPKTPESDTDSLLEDNTKDGKVVPKSTLSQIYTPCRKLIGRKAIHYQLLPRRTILANLAKLAIVPILEKHFPAEQGIVPPIRIELIKQLGVDDNEAERLERELDERYGVQIASQRNFSLIRRRAIAEFKRYERTLANPHTAAIPDGLEYGNKSEYLRACARAIMTQEPESKTQWSQSAWSRLLGCAPRSLDGIFKAADIEQEKNQFEDVPIPRIEDLQRIEDRYDVDRKGFPCEVISSTKRDAFPFEPGQPLYLWAGSQLESGATVNLRYRQANKQILNPVRKPAPLTYWRLLSQKAVIAFLIVNPIPLKESKPKKKKAQTKPKPTYAEKVITTMVREFTPLTVDDGTMIDPLTGEHIDATLQAMIDGLLNAPVSTDKKSLTIDPLADDPLISALLSLGGVVSSVTYHEAEPVAA